MFTEVSRAGAATLGGKSANVILSLLFVVLLSQVTSVSVLGEVFLAISIATFLGLSAQWGFNQLLVRKIPIEVDENPIITLTLLVSLAACLVVSIAVVSLTNFVNFTVITDNQAAFVLLFFSTTFQSIAAEIHRGRRNLFRFTLFSGLLANLLTCSVLFYCLTNSESLELEEVLMTLGIAQLLSAGLGLSTISIQSLRLPPKEQSKQYMHEAQPFLITGLVNNLVVQLDLWVVAYFANEEQLGLYAAMLRLTRFTLFGIVIINAVLPPFVSKLHQEGSYSKASSIVGGFVMIGALSSIAVALFYTLFGEYFITHFLGVSYVQGIAILLVLTLGEVFHALLAGGSIVLAMTGYQGTLMRITVTFAILKLMLLFVLAAKFGAIGAAVSVMCSLFLLHLTLTIFCLKLTPINPLPNIHGVKVSLFTRSK